MADPHSASDDILTSVRRLVLDGQGDCGGGKLILTPKLRVVPSVARAQPSEALQPLHLELPMRSGPSQPQLVAGLPDFHAPAVEAPVETVAFVSRADSHDPVGIADMKRQPAPVAPTEQALRDLVRDLVREQFQGDLGLQITRNIRKLVKAEIAREMDLRAKD